MRFIKRIAMIGLVVGGFSALVATTGCVALNEGTANEDEANAASATAALVSGLDPNSKVDLEYFSNGMDPGPGMTAHYFSAHVRVDNIAYDKYVAIVAAAGSGEPWEEIPGNFVRQFADGTELWGVSGSRNLTQFAVKYTVAGQTYWDNNGGVNYTAKTDWDSFFGRNIAIRVAGAHTDAQGRVHVLMMVKNLDVTKVVGVRYTLDSWVHWSDVTGTYIPDHPMFSHQDEQEYWDTIVPSKTIGGVKTVTFAGFYRLPSLAKEYWDNHGALNYTVICENAPQVNCSID